MAYIVATYELNGTDVEIRGTYVPGVPERGPSYSHGGLPAEPAYIEDIEVMTADGKWVPVEDVLSTDNEDYVVEYELEEMQDTLQRAAADLELDGLKGK